MKQENITNSECFCKNFILHSGIFLVIELIILSLMLWIIFKNGIFKNSRKFWYNSNVLKKINEFIKYRK